MNDCAQLKKNNLFPPGLKTSEGAVGIGQLDTLITLMTQKSQLKSILYKQKLLSFFLLHENGNSINSTDSELDRYMLG